MQRLAQGMMRRPKYILRIFHRHGGHRSVDAASYFAGHGFSKVRSMTGGIDAWSVSEV